MSESPLDSASYANIDEVITQNLALNIAVDVSKKEISGDVQL